MRRKSMKGLTVLANIAYWQRTLNLTDADVARRLGCSRGTYANRKNRPAEFTIRQLELFTETLRKDGYAMTVEQMLVPLVPATVIPYEDKEGVA